MVDIRIVEIPTMKAAYSGSLSDDSTFEKFALYENGEGKPERYAMFHIISPGALIEKGYAVENLYVPIVLR